MLGIYFWNGDKTQKDAFRIFRSLLIGLENAKLCAKWLVISDYLLLHWWNRKKCYQWQDTEPGIHQLWRRIIQQPHESSNLSLELEGLQDLNFVLFLQFQTSIGSTNLSSKHLFLNDDANADASCYQVSCTNVCRKQIKHQKERAIIKKTLVQNMYNSLAPTLRFETTTFNKAQPSISQMTSSLFIYSSFLTS